MTVYEAGGKHGPVRVFDGNGQEIKDLTRLDTETGEATQHVRDATTGQRLFEGSGRSLRLATQRIELPLPVRVEPMSLHRGGEVVS